MSADNFNAFKSNNYPYLAKIGLGIHFAEKALLRPAEGSVLKVHKSMDTGVMFIELHPGMTRSTLRHLLFTPGIKGVVMQTYGAGNAPTAEWFVNEVRQAIERGLVIVNVTQCVNGGVHPGRYLSGGILAECGVVSGHDMTSEAAITKLMYLFGRGFSPEEVKQRISRDLRGEVTLNSNPVLRADTTYYV